MSNEISIRIEGLGKRYQLGYVVDFSRTFREALTDFSQYASKKFLSKALPLGRASEDGADPDTPKGTFWALRDLNLEIKKGEVIGIIGKNGAGKSTLLKILSRITNPTEGYADIYGRVGSLLEVGTGFHPELTGRENIYLNGAVLGMRKTEIDQKFDEIVAFAETDQFLDTPVKRYSSGMRVRLAFSVAAHLEPEILIVDEVLAVGDAEFQKKCLGKMENVSGQGRTVLFVSHNLHAVKRLCQTGVLLEGGRIVEYGEAETVVDSYLSGGHREFSEVITPDMHRKYPPDLEIFRIQILNSRNEPSTTLLMDEIFRIRIHYTINKLTEKYRIGLLFLTLDGLKLSVTTTENDLGWLEGEEGKTYILEAVIKNPYNAGNYGFVVNVKNSAGEWVDRIEGFRLTVESVSAKKEAYEGYWLVRMESSWSSIE